MNGDKILYWKQAIEKPNVERSAICGEDIRSQNIYMNATAKSGLLQNLPSLE